MLVPLVLLAAWRERAPDDGALRWFVALVLLLEAFMVAVFAARDVFLFYVVFEAMLIPVYFLIGGFGGAEPAYAAVKFLLFSLAGGLLMLAAVIALYFLAAAPGGPEPGLPPGRTSIAGSTWTRPPRAACSSGSSSRSRSRRRCGRCTPGCPTSRSRRRPGTSTLLIGVLDKVGTFGMLDALPAAVPGRGPAGRRR